MGELFELGKEKYMSTQDNTSAKVKLNSEEIKKCLEIASSKLSPLWDIRDYVAVNPFFGFREEKFLEAAKYLEDSSGRSILPEKNYFHEKYKSGQVSEEHLLKALELFEKSYANKNNITVLDLLSFINDDKAADNNGFRKRCISDLVDAKGNKDITDFITKEISRWTSAYFDEGQALWKISTDNKTLYTWWRSLVTYDDNTRELGASFYDLVSTLPDDSQEALSLMTDKLLDRVSLDSSELTDYYYRLIYTVMGWASYIQKFEFESSRSGNSNALQKIGGLTDILTMRLAYDIALMDKNINLEDLRHQDSTLNQSISSELSYIWMTATEVAVRESVEFVVNESKERVVDTTRPDVQMAFCIDVRSEILRRKLENVSAKIQTIGFAGFFGMPISLKGLGHKTSDQNCPILLNSAYEINETSSENEDGLKVKKENFAHKQHFKKTIQSSANSGFSFVETFGFGYIGKIISAGLGKSKPNIDMNSMGLSKSDKKHLHLDTSALSLDEKLALVKGALKNMGLTTNFAKYVLFIGHGSESSNNPYSSALDCGACAGHNGLGNADMLASLLNEGPVRAELSKAGIEIPSDTVFMAGWHNTTKDKIAINLPKNLSKLQKDEIQVYSTLFDRASMKCREERAQNLPQCTNLVGSELDSELNLRANDWSEIRPEWGLARNTSFIVGRRHLTRNLNLDGRSFLHDYDEKNDEDHAILELIMTAPMIVTNWINMQYYASTVDPQKFGAGTKVLNNVVGGIGCIQGNESDLLGGLTEQSVWHNGKYFHEPIRLQVFIEAKTSSIDKIIEKHQLVKDLVGNGWLNIISIDPCDSNLKLYESGAWI